MPRISQAPAVKGSQKWIQNLVNEKSDLLNSRIRTQLELPDTDNITWLSPLAEDGYAEYQDQAFLDLLGITLPNVSLSDFWPSRVKRSCRNCLTFFETVNEGLYRRHGQ